MSDLVRASDAPAADPQDASAVRVRLMSHVPERTWELELLISGALVFALLRLPGAADLAYDRVYPHLSGAAYSLAFGAHYAAKLVLYGLIAAFVIHLTGRAYWGGLVGLQSVYPGGVRWDQTRYGPIFLDVYKRGHPPLETQITRADRFCSAIFAFAFSMVFLLGVVAVMTGVLAGLAYAVSRFLLGGRHSEVLYIGGLGIFFVAPVLMWVDRRYGEALMRAGWPGRAVRAVARASYYGLLGPVYQPVLDILSSNVGRKTIFALTQAFMFGVLTTFLVSEFSRRGVLTADSYDFYPEGASARLVDPGYYEALRDEEAMYPRTPSIQAEVVHEPFVQLFLPYNPRRHNGVIAERCAGVEPLARGGVRMRGPSPPPLDPAREAAVLGCLASLQPVTLNGTAATNLRYHFYQHPRTGVRGIRAMIPTADLPTGENLLVVAQIPRAEGTIQPRRPAQPHHIPFWVVR